MLLISIERQKKAKQRELQRIKYIKSIDYTGNKFAEEVSKILVDFSNDMIKYYDKSINVKKKNNLNHLINNEMTVKNFYKENYPHDYLGSAGAYIRKNLLFKTVLKRMKKGEDFYKIVFKDNYADSIARERIFEGMAQNLKIDYEEIYLIWLKN